MVRVSLTLALASVAVTPGQAQLIHVADFGFSGGVVAESHMHTAARLSIEGTLLVPTMSIDVRLASSLAELRPDVGVQRDMSLRVLRLATLPSLRLHFGAGVGVHSLRSRISGSASEPALADLERRHSGLRPALEGLAAIDVPLASTNAAALRFALAGSLMRSARQLEFSMGIRLAPGRGALLLGEPTPSVRTAHGVRRSWENVVAEMMALEDRLGSLEDVLATPSFLVLKFSSYDAAILREDVARIARILSTSSEALMLSISAPLPAVLGATVTAEGFPANRIDALALAKSVTLQVTRPAASATRSAPR